ncbi:hypothetical protein [Aeromonas hydrophila]|uniref:hypothetical protein n=1 Tax=Aeromonas hydrophila TaxID=644 RepID=UPI001EE1ADC2|nr:hypothetical protein [Aeromonas hydrophila]
MIIGVPKEIKNHEYRVGMAVASVRELTARNHTVFAQSGAGSGMIQVVQIIALPLSLFCPALQQFSPRPAYPSDSKHNDSPLPASSSQLPGDDLAFALQDNGRSPS